jgi:hypothetical protein
MTHRALIERPGIDTTDAYGQPVPGVFALHIAAQPCYWYEAITRAVPGESADGQKILIAASHQMLVPLTADILESDRVNGVRDRRGAIVTDEVMNIKQRAHRRDHALLLLEVIR